MSDVAVTWAKAQDCPTAKAKQVLGCLATYADAEGEVWALVPVLAMESQSTDRTVQRALAALREVGLIELTGRNHLHRGKRVPIWRMNLDRGFASTRARMQAQARARTGDASVTPSAPSGVTPVSPQDVTDVTPTGDTSVTQIGKGITQGLKPSAGASAKAMRLWAGKAPERVSPVRVEAAWADAIGRRAVDDEVLLGAVAAAVKADPDFKRGKAMNLDRWLDEDRFLMWLDVAGARPEAAEWDGPPEVAAAVSAVMGPEQRASYFTPTRWDGERRVLIGRTRFAVERLRQDAGRALSAIGVTVEYGVTQGG